MTLEPVHGCDVIEKAEAQALLDRSAALKWIMIWCGTMAGLMPLVLVLLPFLAAWNHFEYIMNETVINALLGGYSLVLTFLFGWSQKSKVTKAIENWKESKNA